MNGDIAAAEKTISKLTVTLASIEQSLDQALSLLRDPHKLFTEAPDGLRLMLVQAVFDKLWVMDTEVVGSELSNTYHELLTHEAKLTLEAQQQARAQAADAASDSLNLGSEARTYYRHRAVFSDDSSNEDDPDGLTALAARLWVERPHGALPVDGVNSKNPVPPAVERGSNLQHLVAQRRITLNRTLSVYYTS